MAQINEAQWVKEQYGTATNLDALVQLHRRFSTNPESWFAWVFDRLQVEAGQRILEIGGGHGLLWRENAARLPARTEVVVTDLSPGMVAQAVTALKRPLDQPHNRRLTRAPHGRGEAGGTFHFAQANAEGIPFAPGVFEIVVANHMLYHVQDRNRALHEMKRVLRPGGRLLVATNDENHLQELRDLAELAHEKWPDVAQILPRHRLFPFDTALEEISRHFGQVQLHHYANDLVVTDADALADYMLSGLPMSLPTTEQADFRAWVHQQMAQQGVMTIRSATGLIEATNTL